MTDIRQDLKQAVRAYRTQPGFTIAVLLTLALGIGASTAMFSVLNAVLLRPLPQSNAERVVRLYQPNATSETTGLSPLEVRDLKAQSRSLEDVVEYHSMPFTFISERDAQRLQTGVVSAAFFDVLGVQPLLGRLFRPGEDQVGSEPVLLLTYEYWQREFGGATDVIGKTLRMNDRTHTIVGVLPAIPQYPGENDVYMPISSCPFRSGPGWAENRQARGLTVFALKRTNGNGDHASHDAVMSEFRAFSTRMQSEYPEMYPPDSRYGVSAVPLTDLIAQPARATLMILLTATLLLLLIVCSNVGNLMIVRLLRRDAEMAVRTAFGATRKRLASQLLTESALLAAVGGGLGLLVAVVATDGLASFVSRFTPRAGEISVDATVVLFALAATTLTALASGLLPLSALKDGIAAVLRQSSGKGSAGGKHTRVRDVLIVLQVAVSVVLLIGAGLLMRTVVHLQNVDPGFDPGGVMTARLDANWTKYATAADRQQLFQNVLRELRSQPGVQAAGMGGTFPLSGDPALNLTVTVEDRLVSGESTGDVSIATVSDGYFEALGVEILRGRGFNDGEDNIPTNGGFGIINRSMAEHYFPGQDPIGKRLSLNGGRDWGVVAGVVGDVRLGLADEVQDILYVPFLPNSGVGARFMIRGMTGPVELERAMRAAVAAVDPDQPLSDVRLLEAYRGDALSPYRLTAMLMGVFALLALGVTAVGLAGVIAFSVAQRTREIGIRVAIGAQPLGVLRMILGQTLLLAAFGALLGAGVSFLLADSLSTLVVGVQVLDPITFIGVPIALMIVATTAGLLPARHAVRIDPLKALQAR